MANKQNRSDAMSNAGAGHDQIAAIPLVEERMSVSKRQVESGRVRVHVTVEEREDVITEQLRRDEVEVEHVPKNIRVSEVPHVRLEGNTTVIPIVEETVVVEKVLMLVEEIHVRRRTNNETVEIPVTVRSEQARIERQSADDMAPATAE